MDDCLSHHHSDHFYFIVRLLLSVGCEKLFLTFLHNYTFYDTGLWSCSSSLTFLYARFHLNSGQHLGAREVILSGIENFLASIVLVINIEAVLI